MEILITNDDGIDSPGLRKLAEAAARFGHVTVVAPDGQRSAMSQSYSWREDVCVREKEYPVEGVKAYACSGTPVDCVRIGVLSLLPEKPEFVMAGINAGYNIARDIRYSATVGAVLEAADLGAFAVAFSQGNVAYQDIVDRYLQEIMERCIAEPLPKGQVRNVNFPGCRAEECQGIRWDCRVSVDSFYVDSYSSKTGEDGSLLFHLEPGRIWKGSEGTDLEAIIDKYISVGPVRNIG